MKKTFLVFLLFLIFPCILKADTIFFKNGTRLDVQETWEEQGQVKCRLYGTVVVYPMEGIERVEKGEREEQKKNALKNGEQKKNENKPVIKLDRAVLDYYNRAADLARKGEWSDAIRSAKKAFSLAPEETEIQKLLSVLYGGYAQYYKDRGELQEAVENLKYGLEYDPGQTQYKKNITTIYVKLAYDAFNSNDLDGCESFIEEGALYDESNPHLYLLSGEIAYAGNDYRKAEKDWTEALELNPQLSRVRAQLKKLKQEKKIEEGFEVQESGNFSLKFEGVENQDVAAFALDILQDAYLDVGSDFNLYPDHVIPVIVYPKKGLEELGYFPDWASGIYDGKIRFGEALWKNSFRFKEVIYHEYTHVLVFQLGGDAVPLWVNEGLAEYESRRFQKISARHARKKLLLKALRKNQLFHFGDLSRMGLFGLSQLSQELRLLVYIQSESFVTYLIERFSFYDMKEILVRIGSGEPFSNVVQDILYEKPDELEKSWKEQLRE